MPKKKLKQKEVWRPLSIANCFHNNVDFSGYSISNYCRVRQDRGKKLLNIFKNRQGYTRVTINGTGYSNTRLGCMVYETALWHFLLAKGRQLHEIEVNHRGSLDDSYISLEEANGYCADPQKWYEEKILAVEAMYHRGTVEPETFVDVD